MKGIGVFFNQLGDLERIVGLANEAKIDWIAPIMAPDQSSVQLNRREWTSWRKELVPLGVKFVAWFVCDDPVVDAERVQWVMENYPSDAILMNCEKSYEDAGKWKAFTLIQGLMETSAASKPKIFSYPSTPAERYNMDYRSFERSGFWFAPQAYWKDPEVKGDATPKALFTSTYLPQQVHVNRDYRLQVYLVHEKHWGRVVQWDGGNFCIVKDLASSKLYRLPVEVKYEGTYKYMVPLAERKLYDYKTGKIDSGRLLGFQVPEKIVPTVGAYPACMPTPAEIEAELKKVPALVGASIFLGETSTSDHVRAVWNGINT